MNTNRKMEEGKNTDTMSSKKAFSLRPVRSILQRGLTKGLNVTTTPTFEHHTHF